MRSLIATRYAVQAQRHSETLQERLTEARREIDALTVLPLLVADGSAADGGAQQTSAGTERAFFVWNETALARARLTSAVELYDRKGTLISRFALNFPEYSGTAPAPQADSACQWDVFGEAAPFGSEERQMLHAERKICASLDGGPPEPVGTIVIHVLLFDYRTLPFITSQNPYFEVFRPAEGGAPREGTTGSDVEVVIYGWALGPIYTSGPAAWPITDALFAGLYDPAAAAVLDHRAERERPVARVLLERPRLHLRHRLPDADAVRSPRAPGGADDAVGCGLRPRAPGHGAVHARRARAAASRARAAPRDSRELLPEAVSGLRSGVHHPGPGAGAVDSHRTSRTCSRPTSRARPRGPPRSRSG